MSLGMKKKQRKKLKWIGAKKGNGGHMPNALGKVHQKKSFYPRRAERGIKSKGHNRVKGGIDGTRDVKGGKKKGETRETAGNSELKKVVQIQGDGKITSGWGGSG